MGGLYSTGSSSLPSFEWMKNRPIDAPIKEVKITLTGQRLEYPCLLLERSVSHAVLLYSLRHASHVSDVTLPHGTVSYGYYWTDRPYNVYHWVAHDGRTVAYYVNVADHVMIRDDAVEWHDLAVDLLFTPDGRVQILDEDELHNVPAEVRKTVEATRAHILRHRDEIIAEIAAATSRLRRAGPMPEAREEESGPSSRTQ